MRTQSVMALASIFGHTSSVPPNLCQNPYHAIYTVIHHLLWHLLPKLLSCCQEVVNRGRAMRKGYKLLCDACPQVLKGVGVWARGVVVEVWKILVPPLQAVCSVCVYLGANLHSPGTSICLIHPIDPSPSVSSCPLVIQFLYFTAVTLFLCVALAPVSKQCNFDRPPYQPAPC